MLRLQFPSTRQHCPNQKPSETWRQKFRMVTFSKACVAKSLVWKRVSRVALWNFSGEHHNPFLTIPYAKTGHTETVTRNIVQTPCHNQSGVVFRKMSYGLIRSTPPWIRVQKKSRFSGMFCWQTIFCLEI